MFNKDETTYFEFTNSLNSHNFQLTGQTDVRKVLEQLKLKGKVCEQIRSDDDMCKSLGLKIIKNIFSVNNSNFEIYLFLSERYPYEVPVVYISESLVKTDNSAQEVFKYQITNHEEFKKDGKCNIVALLERVQTEIIKKGSMKPKFLDDLNTLKETYDINTVFRSLSQLKVGNLVRDTRNPSPAEISQQFKLTKEYLNAAAFFSQLTSLNDRIITYLREKNVGIETQKKKNLHYCYEVEKVKKQFAAACCALQSVKDRFSKLSVMNIIDDKITQLKARAEDIQKKPFSAELFQEYKAVMKELKLLELKKEKMI